MNSGNATIINRKVYYGGGFTKDMNSQSESGIADDRVYCYDPIRDIWTPLPPLAVKHFCLGQVDNELVATGGVQKGCRQNEIQKVVYTYDKRRKTWLLELPPMLTARCLHGMVSLQSALVVAGGQVFPDSYTNTVEIFKVDENEWYQANPLPVHLFNMSMALLDDTCYVVGGYSEKQLCQVYYMKVEALLSNILPKDQATNLKTTWKTLPRNTPNCQPAAVALAGSLLTIAGAAGKTGETQRGVYVYSSSSRTWDHIGDLPTPQKLCTVIGISSLEMLVIGGWTPDGDKNTVLKGRLHLLS